MGYLKPIGSFAFVLSVAMVASQHAAAQSVRYEDLKLLASDGDWDDDFGRSVAIDGTTAIVGAPFDSTGYGADSGSAYLFDTTTGEQIAKLLASDASDWDRFGWSVAISGDTAIVGVYFNDSTGNLSGSAYLFDVATGEQIAKLLPSDVADDDRFGHSVAISHGTAIVGAAGDDDNGGESGSAYLFDTTTGDQIAKLLPTDGAAGDSFGMSVAINGTIAIVGAGGDYDRSCDCESGSAYLFDTTTGNQIAKLLADDRDTGDEFGYTVAISGATAIVGARFDDDNGDRSGSAYLFDTTTGEQTAKLVASDGAEMDWFGWSVAISADTAIVGAYSNDDNGDYTGSAYLFDVATGEQIAKLLASDGEAWDRFGWSVAISGDTAVIGAIGDDDNGYSAGAAYIFNLDCLQLDVANLVAGEQAQFAVSNGTPSAKGVTVYGTQAGETSVTDYGGYCATFAIKGVNQSKVIGGLNQVFDANGGINFNVTIPGNTSGLSVLFQSAERGTCPDECVSNLVEATVQ